MNYCYECECGEEFEVVKSVRFIDTPEHCPKCDKVAQRVMSSSVFFIGAKVEDAEYNPGLGQVIKNRKHRDEVARQKGLVEIGNQDVHGMSESFAKQREEKRAKAYDNL
jgi:putative FmdB family regulatory protein